MDYPKQLRTLSLCTGYGGIERGIELTGITVEPVAHVEIEAFAIANLVAKMETGTLVPCPIWTDIKTFPAEPFYGLVDLITAGFPCPPFSGAGKGAADTDSRHLFPHIKRIISAIKPRYVFLENVDGIASAKLKGSEWADTQGTPVLLHVCRELERIGYGVQTGCYTAGEMGATHQRKRWFILAHCQDIRCGRGQDSHGDHGSGVQEPTKKIKSVFRVEIEGRSGNLCGDLWPLPPGPHQWEWEEPRTVAHSNSERKLQPEGTEPEQWERPVNSGQGETKPSMGGSIDGTANRLDQLRLLGNGVCPPQAGRAFIDLWTKLHYPPK